MSGKLRIAALAIVLAAPLLASAQQAKDKPFVRVRLWRAQPKHANVTTSVDMRCPPYGRPCTNDYVSWERLQRVECVLVTSNGFLRREVGLRNSQGGAFKIYAGPIDPADLSRLNSLLASWKGSAFGVPVPASQDAYYSNKARMFYAAIDWSSTVRQQVWLPDKAAQERSASQISPVLEWWKDVDDHSLKMVRGIPNGCTSVF